MHYVVISMSFRTTKSIFQTRIKYTEPLMFDNLITLRNVNLLLCNHNELFHFVAQKLRHFILAAFYVYF